MKKRYTIFEFAEAAPLGTIQRESSVCQEQQLTVKKKFILTEVDSKEDWNEALKVVAKAKTMYPEKRFTILTEYDLFD